MCGGVSVSQSHGKCKTAKWRVHRCETRGEAQSGHSGCVLVAEVCMNTNACGSPKGAHPWRPEEQDKGPPVSLPSLLLRDSVSCQT